MTSSIAAARPTPSWRDVYPPHPCADVYPMMSNDEIEKLAEDIKVHGLHQPIVLWDCGERTARWLVLDGRNRLEALTQLGIEIPSDPYDASGIKGSICPFTVANSRGPDRIADPASYVISANIHRRHLTKEQQAELIVKTIEAGEASRNDRAKPARSFSPTPTKKGGSTKDPILDKAVKEAARHGISKRTVQNARAKVHGNGREKRTAASPTTATQKKRQREPPPDLRAVMLVWVDRLNDWEKQMREVEPFMDYVAQVPSIAQDFRQALTRFVETAKRLL
jgi:hypothetical protein